MRKESTRVNLDADQMEWVRERARQQRCSISQVIRTIIAMEQRRSRWPDWVLKEVSEAVAYVEENGPEPDDGDDIDVFAVYSRMANEKSPAVSYIAEVCHGDPYQSLKGIVPLVR